MVGEGRSKLVEKFKRGDGRLRLYSKLLLVVIGVAVVFLGVFESQEGFGPGSENKKEISHFH